MTGYRNLNDASSEESVTSEARRLLKPGRTEIWYMKKENFRWASSGLEFLKDHPELYPDPFNLSRTHVLVGRISAREANQVFQVMQGDFWSPEGQARSLIKDLGLIHTSMSVGDVMVIDGEIMVVEPAGFVRIGSVDR